MPDSMRLYRVYAMVRTLASVALPRLRVWGNKIVSNRRMCAAAVLEVAQTRHKVPKTNLQSVRIPCSGNAADELVEALMCFGASSCSIEDANRTGGQVSEDGPVPWEAGPRQLWDKSCITALFAPDVDVPETLAFAADSLGLREIPKYELEELEECDWLQQVKDVFQPIQVADSFWIVPEWCTPPDSEALNVILDPGLAFGTGEHPTTKLCLRLLHKTIKGGEYVLDYGTGSGVLGIAALKMGAAQAAGVDIDPLAVSSASSNAALNKLEPHLFDVFVATVDGDDPVPYGSGAFDVVVANILLNPLVKLSSRIANYVRVGGVVALSGIIMEQVERVIESYSPFLRDIEIMEDDGWVCIIGTKK